MSARRPGGLLVISLLTGAWARAFIWAYFGTMAILAVWTLDDVASPWPTLIGLVLAALVALVLSLDTAPRLRLRTTYFVVIIGVVNCLLISWQIVQGGHSQWYFGAGTVALFFVSLRGRILEAWLGFVAMAVIIAVWGITTATGPTEAAMVIGRQAPIILIGTLFATGLTRTGAAIDRLSAETSLKAAAEAAAAATLAERVGRLAALDEIATPLLTRLVDSTPPTAEERLEFFLAEAELRDGLRARALSVPSVVLAAREARRRGVGVILLDDSGPHDLTEEDVARAAEATSVALDQASDGKVTARLLPPGRANVATVVVDGTDYHSYEVPRLG